MGCWGVKAFESDEGLDVLEWIRNHIPENGCLRLKGLSERLKLDEWCRPPAAENGESHSSTTLIAELMESFQNGTIEEWEYLPNNLFGKVVSFLVEKGSVKEMCKYLSKALESTRKNTQNSQQNGWFEEISWNEWQEHMESLIETMRKILEQDGEVLDLIPWTKQGISEEHIGGGTNMGQQKTKVTKNTFGLDFAVDGVPDQFCDWIYGKLITFFGEFFSMINMVGAELFELDWIKAILLFFYYFAWALYIVGIVVAVSDTATDARRGKGSFQDLTLNTIKGFFTVSLFTVVPIDPYVLCINLLNELIGAIAGMSDSPGKLDATVTMVLGSFGMPGANMVVSIVSVILIGYVVIKVFFANLKRGGILLVMMATGSLYLFSIPGGYSDGFVSWCKQVAALCLTTFLQTIMLVAGLITYNINMLPGIGLMPSSTKVPKIAQDFGLDTNMRFNAMSTVYSVNSVANMARNIGRITSR